MNVQDKGRINPSPTPSEQVGNRVINRWVPFRCNAELLGLVAFYQSNSVVTISLERNLWPAMVY